MKNWEKIREHNAFYCYRCGKPLEKSMFKPTLCPLCKEQRKLQLLKYYRARNKLKRGDNK